MAASKHINPDQLRLFMTPKEIMDQYEPGSGDVITGESHEDVWDRKATESHRAGLTESIREKGIQVPVRLSSDPRFPEVLSGHHRIAAAHHIDPNMSIPVAYGDPASITPFTEEIQTINKYKLWDLPNTSDVRRDEGDTGSNYNSSSSEW